MPLLTWRQPRLGLRSISGGGSWAGWTSVASAISEPLVAAEIAEALAVTTYTGIVRTPAFFSRLPDDDQGYLYAARQEEMSLAFNSSAVDQE